MYRIAISGHRGLPAPTGRLVDQALRAALAERAPDVTGLSCLADGADQIFARAVTDLGGTLEAVIPAAQYREGLPADSRAETVRSVGRQASVMAAAAPCRPSSRICASPTSSSTAPTRACGSIPSRSYCWAGFGGAVEEGETIEQALRREVLEETGLEISGATFLTSETDRENRELADELFGAALRGADNATRLIVIAALHEEEGYDLGTVINRLGKGTAALATAAESAAFLVHEAEPDSPHLTVAIRFWTLLLDAARAKIPAQALTGLGRWAFVANVDDDQWADLTARSLDATGGSIDYPISVADRAARLPPSETSRSVLLRLLDTGDPWERHHAAIKALDVLSACTPRPG